MSARSWTSASWSSLNPWCILVDEDATDEDATDEDATDEDATDESFRCLDGLHGYINGLVLLSHSKKL